MADGVEKDDIYLKSRGATSLSGEWHLIVDPFDEGVENQWYKSSEMFEDGKKVEVPGEIDSHIEVNGFIESVFWYAKNVDQLMPADNWRREIQFDGVNNCSMVWIDGISVGGSSAPFLPFVVEMQPGKSSFFLVIRVDNRRTYDTIPGPVLGWKNVGGILRDVWMHDVPAIRICDFLLSGRLDRDGSGTVAVSFSIENASDADEAVSITSQVSDSNGAIVWHYQSNRTIPPCEFAYIAVEEGLDDIVPWSCERPELYDLTLEITSSRGTDMLKKSTGFRHIENRGSELLLNGEPIFLRGFNRHEDSPARGGSADRNCTENDIRAMKLAGANFLRCAHYPHDQSVLDICDRLGMLVMEEIPLYWYGRPEKGFPFDPAHSDAIAQAALRQCKRLVNRDIHHPSTIIWSVANECAELLPEVDGLISSLLSEVRILDSSRLVTHASNVWVHHPNFDDDDLIALNGYPTTAARSVDRMQITAASKKGSDFWTSELKSITSRYPDKPILVTEIGYPAYAGTKIGGWSETEQTCSIEAELSAIEASNVAGVAIWCWADHGWPAGELMHQDRLAVYPSMSPYGVVDRKRRPKLAHDAISRRWRTNRIDQK